MIKVRARTCKPTRTSLQLYISYVLLHLRGAFTAQGLDEVQCFVLLRRVQKQDQISLQAKCTASLLLRVSQYYFAERECLLKCLQWLLLKGLLAEPGVSQDDPDLPADVRLARATLDKLTERVSDARSVCFDK